MLWYQLVKESWNNNDLKMLWRRLLLGKATGRWCHRLRAPTVGTNKGNTPEQIIWTGRRGNGTNCPIRVIRMHALNVREDKTETAEEYAGYRSCQCGWYRGYICIIRPGIHLYSGIFLCTAPCRGNMPQKRRMGRAASRREGHSPTRLHTGIQMEFVSRSWRVPGARVGEKVILLLD